MDEKVLIISHLAINNTNNVGKTLFLLFKYFDSENLSQLFFTTIDPNVNVCKTWYKITDEDILKSIISSPAGEKAYVRTRVPSSQSNHTYKKRKSTSRLLLRDLVWKFGHYDVNKLDNWIKDFSPAIIFLAPGPSIFAYKIALRIAEKNNIPIITFMMDDYYDEIKNICNPIEWIRHFLLKKYINKTVYKSSMLLTVCEDMAITYKKMFNCNTDIIYTPYEIGNDSPANKINQSLKFVYAGSLGINRWKIIKSLGECLDTGEKDAKLIIYASSDYKEELENLKKIKSIEYGGFLNSKELDEKIKESDIVVHVESFDKKSLNRTKFSISTKIPECLASGKIFFAIGPENQAAIKYLKDNNAAIVCSDITKLSKYVDSITSRSLDYTEYRRNAKRLLEVNHNPIVIHKKLEKTIVQVIDDYNKR